LLTYKFILTRKQLSTQRSKKHEQYQSEVSSSLSFFLFLRGEKSQQHKQHGEERYKSSHLVTLERIMSKNNKLKKKRAEN
jgi:hypothetical protein